MFRYYWLLCLIEFGNSGSYFCNFKCGKKHTVCKREPCGPASKCGPHFKMLQLDDESRQWVLDAHNEHRNKIALGQDTRGGNGVAANMNALSYSKEIEFVAQCWANACGTEGAHDQCRSTKQFNYVGQNMFGISGTGHFDFREQKYVLQAVNGWYGEIKDMDASIVDKFHSPSSGKPVGHFTQLVWAKTTHIGCGRTQYGRGKTRGMVFYCNYGVGGNMLGAPVYERGEPCSKCGSNNCNSNFEGLCGQVQDLSLDTWEPPFQMGSGFQASCYRALYVLTAFILLL